MKLSKIAVMVLMSGALVTPLLAQAQEISNQDIILMLNAHVADSIIISRINAPTAQIDTSTQSIIDLARAGASDEVMAAVLAKGSHSPLQPKSPQSEPSSERPVAEFEMAQVEFVSLSVSQSIIRVNVRIKNTYTNTIYAYGNERSEQLYSGGNSNLARCGSVSLTDELGNDYTCTTQTLNGYVETNGYGNYDHDGEAIPPNQKLNAQYVFAVPNGIRTGSIFSLSADPYVYAWDNLADRDSPSIDKRLRAGFGKKSSLAFNFDGLQKPKPAPAISGQRR